MRVEKGCELRRSASRKNDCELRGVQAEKECE